MVIKKPAKQELKIEEETSVQDEQESIISKDNSEAYSELQKELENELQRSEEKPNELERRYTEEKRYRDEPRNYEPRRPQYGPRYQPYESRYQTNHRGNTGTTLKETRAIAAVLNTVYEQLSKLHESGEPTEAYEILRKTARILSEFNTKRTHTL
jgi:hypothetical protein